MFPKECSFAARQALSIWGHDVVPTLFPFMVLCRMLSTKLRTCRMPARPAVIILGLIGGSPTGAAALSLFGNSNERSGIQSSDILPLCVLTGTMGPVFFLSSLSSWLGNCRIPTLVMGAHYGGAMLSALLVGFCIPHSRRSAETTFIQTEGNDSPIMQSVDAILHVGGCIIFYSVAASMLEKLLPRSGLFCAIVHCCLEAAGGMHALIQTGIQERILCILLACASGFSGLSILSQNLMFLSPLGVKMHHLMIFGCLRALLSALLVCILSLF